MNFLFFLTPKGEAALQAAAQEGLSLLTQHYDYAVLMISITYALAAMIEISKHLTSLPPSRIYARRNRAYERIKWQ